LVRINQKVYKLLSITLVQVLEETKLLLIRNGYSFLKKRVIE